MRTIDFPPSHKIIAMNPLSDSGRLYLHYYPYKAQTNKLPKFVLTPKDSHWYEFFKQELMSLWNDGTPWPCEPTEQKG